MTNKLRLVSITFNQKIYKYRIKQHKEKHFNDLEVKVKWLNNLGLEIGTHLLKCQNFLGE